MHCDLGYFYQTEDGIRCIVAYRELGDKYKRQYWHYTGTILALYWRYTGLILALYWRYTGAILALYWRYTGAILALY